MHFGAQVLDTYIAPRLSELQDCSPPDLPELPHYRGSLVLYDVFCGVAYPDDLRVPISLFISRLRETIFEYRSATEYLQKYVAALPDHGQLGAHTRSVAHFETCIIKADLAATLLKLVAARIGAPLPWNRRDGSTFERIHLMSNRIKHFDEDIGEAARMGKALPLAPIWLIRSGLECSRCCVSFDELTIVLRNMAEDAENFGERWPALAAERRRQQMAAGSQSDPAAATTLAPASADPGNVVSCDVKISIPKP